MDLWWKPFTEVTLTEPRWARAVEMRPGSVDGRKIVHHAVARLQQEDPDAPDTKGNIVDKNNEMGQRLMEWAIGEQYDDFHANTGRLIVPGARISWDIHLHAVGEPIRDHVELGIYFYPKGQEPKYRTVLTTFPAFPFSNTSDRTNLDIPPNSIAETQGFTVLKQSARLESFQPHMHLRGKAMAMEAILPDGTTQMLSYVDHFSFNWMINYIYADDSAPVLPKGTIIHVSAWHDNTAANPNNPDPKQWVGYGDRTVDEMAYAFVNVVNISEQEYKDWASKHAIDPHSSRSSASR
jgi:hypothetical protein